MILECILSLIDFFFFSSCLFIYLFCGKLFTPHQWTTLRPAQSEIWLLLCKCQLCNYTRSHELGNPPTLNPAPLLRGPRGPLIYDQALIAHHIATDKMHSNLFHLHQTSDCVPLDLLNRLALSYNLTQDVAHLWVKMDSFGLVAAKSKGEGMLEESGWHFPWHLIGHPRFHPQNH